MKTDYFRDVVVGTTRLASNTTATFEVDGYWHRLNSTPGAEGDFTVTYRECLGSPCGPPQDCQPYHDLDCKDLFEEPCAYPGQHAMLDMPYTTGCCIFIVGGTICMEWPDGYTIDANEGKVDGVYQIPDGTEFECRAIVWPNFACSFDSPMAEILDVTVCKAGLPMECHGSGGLVDICIHGPICPTVPLPGFFDPGTVIRVYPGPYWDQVSDNGTWDGYTYHYGITVWQEWDRNSRLAARLDGEGNPTNYTYDDLNRQKGEVYPDGSEIRLAFDGNDNVVTLWDPNGNVVTNVYDALDRLVEVEVFRGPGVVGTDRQVFTYDGLGRKVSSMDYSVAAPGDAVEASWVYDSLGNVVSESVDGFTVTSGYDSMGNRVSVGYPDGRLVGYAYDGLGRLARIDDLVPPVHGIAAYVEEALAEYHYLGGLLVAREYANGVERSLSYVDPGANSTRPLRVEDRDEDGTLLVGFGYVYDAGGSKQSVRKLHAPDRSERFGLDGVNRLVDYERGALDASGSVVTVPASDGLQSQSWELTDANNWGGVEVKEAGAGSVERVRVHDDRNRLVDESVGGVVVREWLYDDNGNLVDDGVFRYGWDFRNRLVEVEAWDASLHHVYRYDGENRRVVVERDGVVSRFVLDGVQELEERTGSGALKRQYVYGPGIDEVVVVDRYVVVDGLDGDAVLEVVGAVVAVVLGVVDSVGFCPSGEAGVVLDGDSYCVPVGGLPDIDECPSGEEGVVVDGVPVCVTVPDPPSVGLCPSGEVGVVVDGASLCVDPLVVVGIVEGVVQGVVEDVLALVDCVGASDPIQCAWNTLGLDALWTVCYAVGFHPAVRAIEAELKSQPVIGSTGLPDVQALCAELAGHATGQIPIMNPQVPGAPFVQATWTPIGLGLGGASIHAGRYWYHLDDQHSTIALTNDEGVVVEGYEYTPYGEPVIYVPGPSGILQWGPGDIILTGGTSPLGNTVLYTGRSWDADTGLYYYRTRYMSPEMGRFISSDTIGVWGDAGNLGNGYAYVGNSPFDWTDPEGECRGFAALACRTLNRQKLKLIRDVNSLVVQPIAGMVLDAFKDIDPKRCAAAFVASLATAVLVTVVAQAHFGLMTAGLGALAVMIAQGIVFIAAIATMLLSENRTEDTFCTHMGLQIGVGITALAVPIGIAVAAGLVGTATAPALFGA